MTSFHQYRSEQRQHINLSKHAYETIKSDSITFSGGLNLSGIINRIFLNYYEQSKAAISNQAKLQELRLRELIPETDDNSQIIHLIVDNYSKDAIQSSLALPKDIALKIRLQNEVYDLLYPSEGIDWPEKSFYPSPGSFLKAVLEDYATLSFYKREAIYYKQTIDTISSVIDSLKHPLLAITYVSAQGNLRQFIVKPFLLSSEAQGNYNYLIGKSASFDADKDFINAVFRISRIKKIKVYAESRGSGRINNSEKKELSSLIAEKGIAFLSGDSEEIIVSLTPNGIQQFQSIIHLRPLPTKIEYLEDGSAHYHFNCTVAQISYYFFQFGDNARIIKPTFLEEQFRRRYQLAYQSYSNKEDAD